MTDKTDPIEDKTILAVPPVEDKTVPPVVPEPEKKAEDPPAKVEPWPSTGTEVGDSVLAVLQDSGITLEAAKALVYDATATGDLSKIDKAKLEAAVGKARANLVLIGVGKFVADNAAAKAAVDTIVHTATGGKANWDKVTAWAKANLSTDEVDDYIDMVGAGGRKANMAATDLRARYEDANGSLVDGTIIPTKTAPVVEAVKPLSRTEYYNECVKLRRAGGTDDDFAALWKRREEGKKQNT